MLSLSSPFLPVILVRADDAVDGVLQQVAVDALPRGQDGARICVAEVVVGEETEDDFGEGVDLVLGVAWDADRWKLVLKSGEGVVRFYI